MSVSYDVDMTKWQECVDQCALGYAESLAQVRGPDDPTGYPREANAVHLLANELERQGRRVVLEAEYWHQYNDGRSDHRSYADMWCEDPELFVEVKLAELLWKQDETGDSYKIGSESLKKVLASYADDIWDLLTLAPYKDRVTEVGFVVVAFGRGDLRFETTEAQARTKKRDADRAWKHVVGLGSHPQALHELLATAPTILGATTYATEVPRKAVVGDQELNVSCLALTWSCEAPWRSTWDTTPYPRAKK